MNYADLVRYYQSHVGQLGSDAANQQFNSWTSQLEKELGIPGGNFDDPASGWATITPDVLDQFETTGGDGSAGTLNTSGGGVPLEQGILQKILPGLVNDINADAGRRNLADTLSKATTDGASAANAQLARTQGGRFDGTTYFNQNPDVAAEYQRQGGQAGTKMSPDQFAEKHYLEFGQREGRKPVYIQSAQLAADFNNADRTVTANINAANQATATTLAALGQATTQLQQNLQGNLAAKAAALQQNLAALNANLDTLDATQRANLAQQIATQQKDLEQSIATQRQALQDQMAALSTNASTQNTAQKAALQDEIAALGTANTAEAQARRAALQQQLATIDQGISDSSSAQMAALQKEIAGLTAAQEPLNAARLAAADLQATAVNVGLEHTKDQLTADAAKAGFVGGSTVQDAALARATIGARGEAARAMGGARLANAADTRDIGVRGATGERTIADTIAAQRLANTTGGANAGYGVATDEAHNAAGIAARGATGQRTIADALAAAQRDISDQGATGQAALTGAQARGTQSLSDTQAAGLAGIGNQTALSRAGIGAYGANTTYGNATTGADQARTINDALAQGQFGLTATNAQQQLAAQQQGAAAKATYWDADWNRSLAAALAPASIAASTASGLTALDNYANSGLGRALNTLNWWSTPTTPAPAPGAITTTPSTTGNATSNLGAGLLSAGLNLGQANNWWSKPATPSTTIDTSKGSGLSPPPVSFGGK